MATELAMVIEAPTQYRLFDTPAGPFTLICAEDGQLRAMWTNDTGSDVPPGSHHDPSLLPALSAKLTGYFDGKPVEFDDVVTPPGPAFHHRCWAACRRIPRGETRTYGWLAAEAGSGPGASRAAGQAMRTNPMSVIVPCHRVVAAGGRLHGYAGSRDPAGRELRIKRMLLELEGAAAGPQGLLLPA